MKVAIVHEWFDTIAGSERCVESFNNLYPESEIYALVDYLDEKDKKELLGKKRVYTTFLQKFPFGKKLFRNLLPLFPLAVEQHDLREFDLILSSSHSVSKGLLRNQKQIHICYCHTPMRYAWDMYHEYTQELNFIKRVMAKYFLHKIRIWDISSLNRVDYFIANSKFIQHRIKKVYNRESTVIYPPVDVERFELCEEKEDYYVAFSRLVPYKKIDLIVEAFNANGLRLKVLGTGPEIDKLKALASSNIEILGYQDDANVVKIIQRAKALVFAAIEDFGIVPVEAQACGTPVVCLNQGGTAETVVDEITGVYFEDQSITSINNAIHRFEENSQNFNPKQIRDHALQFSKKRFEKEIYEFINAKMR